MAGEDRAAESDLGLLAELRDRPFQFDFFQALRRLECFYADKPRIGTSGRPAEDAVRLTQDPSLAFAPATLASFEPGAQGRPWRLASRFFGMMGPNGPLPHHLTEYARDRLRNHDDPTMIRFLDVFHHRMLALFYRAWADAEPTANLDRPESDRFAIFLGSLCGIGSPTLRHRDAMPDMAKLFFAGRFACQTRNKEGLLALVHGFFQIPAEVDEFVGEWLTIPDGDLCCLGQRPMSATLGESATIGARSWQSQFKFRIRLGAMDYEKYRRLLPGGQSLTRLVALVLNYTGRELNWDVNLILKKDQVPQTSLGRSGQLGWTTWLTSLPRQNDAGDLTLNPFTKASDASPRELQTEIK